MNSAQMDGGDKPEVKNNMRFTDKHLCSPLVCVKHLVCVIKADKLTELPKASVIFCIFLVLLGDSYLLIQITTHFVSHGADAMHFRRFYKDII